MWVHDVVRGVLCCSAPAALALVLRSVHYVHSLRCV